MTQEFFMQDNAAEVNSYNDRSVARSRPSAWRAIVWAGFVAGTLDLTDAFVFSGIRGASPGAVLRYIAGGWLGTKAFRGGAGTMLLGGLSHYTIAFTAAAVFYAASRKWPFLTRRPVAAGLLYGCAVYAFMNFVVVPLSALPHRPMATGVSLINGVLAILLLVGLPIALIVHRDATLER